MKKIDIFFKKYIKGDLHLWIFISLLSIFSFFSVYHISSNYIFFYEKNLSNIFSVLFKHFFFLFIGFIILFITQFIDYRFFYKMSKIFLQIVLFILLFTTIIKEKKIFGTSIFRWIHIHISNKSFQISNIASIFLFIYCARYLTDKKEEEIELISSFVPLLLPIFLVLGLIFTHSWSNAIIVFISILIFLFIGGYPIINIIGMFLISILFSVIYILFFIHFNEKKNIDNKENIWKNNIEKFSFEKENYQIIKSKTIINIYNKIFKDSEKNIITNFLPESYYDFIYSIIIEKYGFFGGIILLFIYLLILFRIIIIATKVQNYFCTLLVFSVGFPIIIQALVNMGVSVGIFPFTNQPLPLINIEYSSIFITFFSFGIILSVSRIIYEKSKL